MFHVLADSPMNAEQPLGAWGFVEELPDLAFENLPGHWKGNVHENRTRSGYYPEQNELLMVYKTSMQNGGVYAVTK